MDLHLWCDCSYIPGRIVSFLTNVHTSPRAIYLCCSDNADVVEHSGGDLFDKYKGPLGSDNDLSAANAEIAQKLAAFLETELPYEVHGERVAVSCCLPSAPSISSATFEQAFSASLVSAVTCLTADFSSIVS